MKKSDRRAQYERSAKKESGGGNGGNVQRTKMSRKQLERKAREVQATKRSMKTVSEIMLDDTEEGILVDLIARLQDIKLVEKAEDLPKVFQQNESESENEDTESSNSDQSSNSDEENEVESENEEGDDDEEESPIVPETEQSLKSEEIIALDLLQKDKEEVITDPSKFMLKSAFIRKLIRDDRRARKALSSGDVQSSEKIAAKIRRTIQSKNPAKDVLSPKPPSIDTLQPSTPSTKHVGTAGAASQSVRLSISCPKGKGKSEAPKLLVYPRIAPVEEIISKMRAKFGVGAKFNALKIVSSGILLDDFEMMTLPDGEQLHLVAEEKKNLSKRPSTIAPTENTKAPVSAPPESSVKCETPVKEDKLVNKEENSRPNEDLESGEIDWTAPSLPVQLNLSDLPTLNPNPALSKEILDNYQRRARSSRFLEVQSQREQLPIFQQKQEIIDLINRHQVVVISGETGSGKTTQLPHYLLEDMITRERGAECNITCTQPRRIAAISVAERVHYELLEEKETLGDGLVGYQIRLDSRSSNRTRLLYCTTGVLLRKLQHPQYLLHASHIIIDEIHERGVETDFLMTILKQQLAKFPHLKLILMSATLQEDKFQTYFNDCPIVYVSGRMFPVKVHYKEEILTMMTQRRKQSENDMILEPSFDPQFISSLLSYIVTHYPKAGEVRPEINAVKSRGEAVLIFLSGIQQIEQLNKVIRQNKDLKSDRIKILILHSTIPPEQQKKVFKPTLPGEWKIILSTNIAETSITVDDVTHVIDCGFMKEQRFHPISGISALQQIFISRSNAQQRSGRAGRVKPGICWRVYHQGYFQSNVVEEYPIPEIKRIPLEEIILQILYLQLGKPELFLSQCLESPSIQQIRAAIANLIEMKAILPKPNLPLTALGYHLARMPVDIRIGKMLIYGCLLECIEPVLTVAASLSCKSPFFSPLEKREEARRIHLQFLSNRSSNLSPSDHIAIVKAFDQWYYQYQTFGKQKGFDFSRAKFLSNTVLLEIRATRDYYRRYLIDAGFLSPVGHGGDSSLAQHVKTQLLDSLQDMIDEVDNEDFENDEDGEIAKSEVIFEKSPQKKTTIPENSDNTVASIHEHLQDLLTRCALTAGLFPNIIRGFRIPHPQKDFVLKFVQSDQKTVSIHPSSLLSSRVSSLVDTHRQDAFFIYHMKSAVNDQIQVFDLTKIPHLLILLFTNNEINLSNPGKKNSRLCKRIKIRDWIEMEITELQLAIFRLLQKEMEKLLILHVEKTLEYERRRNSNHHNKDISVESNKDYEGDIQRYKDLLVKIILILMRNA